MKRKLIRNSVSSLVIAVMIMSLFAVPGISGAEKVFADTEGESEQMEVSGTDTTSLELAESDMVESLEGSLSQDPESRDVKTTYNTIAVRNLITGNEALEGALLTPRQVYKSGSNVRYGFSQKVTISSKGMMILSAMSNEQGLTYGLFYDAAMTKQVASGTSFASKGSAGARAFKVPQAGTYYIGAYYYGKLTKQFAMAAAFANGADRTIGSGSMVFVGMQDGQSNYFKIKAAKTGYLKVEASNYGNVSLYNSNKKALSKQTSTSYAPTYGVKKGKTYYVRIDMGYISFDKGGYQFRATNGKISEKSGKKRSKAVTIKKKKTKKGTITAGSKRADWYKVKLNSKKKMKVTMKGRTNDTLKITIYTKNGKKIRGASAKYSYFRKKIVLKSTAKLPKGTYYIKVSRANKYSSGWYSLKWK